MGRVHLSSSVPQEHANMKQNNFAFYLKCAHRSNMIDFWVRIPNHFFHLREHETTGRKKRLDTAWFKMAVAWRVILVGPRAIEIRISYPVKLMWATWTK